MSILDISNWTINEINNSIDAFKDTSLTDIGMVNCDIESINIVGGITTATLWIDEEIGIDGYTGTAPLKIYKEDKVEIKLNSPLLEGDTIEVKDGKLCHYHKMGMVVLDGSELDGSEEGVLQLTTNMTNKYRFKIYIKNIVKATTSQEVFSIFCDKYIAKSLDDTWFNRNGISIDTNSGLIIYDENLQTLSDFKVWFQQNPTTVIYELASPYYEDITPLQSSIILKTFLESSMIINTNLPIKTNVSYRTNVPSISTLSNRVAEVSESDNVIHNLINIIDDEVDE